MRCSVLPLAPATVEGDSASGAIHATLTRPCQVDLSPHQRASTLETDLYRPIKRHLERLGLEVKGEVCGCDLVALSDGSPELVVVGEMKQSFTLELVLHR